MITKRILDFCIKLSLKGEEPSPWVNELVFNIGVCRPNVAHTPCFKSLWLWGNSPYIKPKTDLCMINHKIVNQWVFQMWVRYNSWEMLLSYVYGRNFLWHTTLWGQNVGQCLAITDPTLVKGSHAHGTQQCPRLITMVGKAKHMGVTVYGLGDLILCIGQLVGPVIPDPHTCPT